MRCEPCNNNLNDFESTLRDTHGNFLNTCRKCLKGLGIPTLGRADLKADEPAPVDFDEVDQMIFEKLDTWSDDD